MKSLCKFALAASLCSGLTVPLHAQELDCLSPAPEATPGTPEWQARDSENQACAAQRASDTAAVQSGSVDAPSPLRDTLRDPGKHAGQRFRFDAANIANRAGADLPIDVFRPCTPSSCTDVPEGVRNEEGPYPTVVIVHGGASNRQLHWWAAQGLAEQGYMTVALDVAETSGGDHGTDTQDLLEWLFSADFLFAAELRADRVGIVGHSQGASTASLIGQLDSRIKTIVAWDNLTALKAGWDDDIGVAPPADIALRVPALGIGADYYFTPRPYAEAPEPATSNGEGGRGCGFSAHPKDLGYQEMRADGVDTLLFILRAGTHLDFTPTTRGPSGSRYGQAVSLYLTLAWFDRYLRGLDDPALARDAFQRLVGVTVLDDSVDAHHIGSGIYDPVNGNQPILLEGLSLCDRMSFYFKSRYALRAPGSTQVINSEDWRADCYAGKTQALPAIPSNPPREPEAPVAVSDDGGRFGSSSLDLLSLALCAWAWSGRRLLRA